MSRYGKRSLGFVEYADPVWQIPIAVQSMTNAQRQKLEAFISAAKGGTKTILYTPRHVCIPQAYWGDKNNPVLANGTLSAISGGNVITINGLASGTPSANMVVNPGLETGAISPWVTAAGVTVGTGTGHSGTRFMLFDKGAAGIGAGTQREAFQVIDGIVAGSTYLASGWLRGAVAAAAGGFINLQWRNAANGVISVNNVANNVGYNTTWAQYSGTFVAPALATRVLMYPVLTTGGAAQTMEADDFNLQASPQLVIKAGDLVSLTTGSSSLIVRALEDAVAVAGSIIFTIEPYLPSYITVGAVARFKDPQMTVRLMPGSFEVGSGPLPSASFTLIEVPQ